MKLLKMQADLSNTYKKNCPENKYQEEDCHQDFECKWSLKWVDMVPWEVLSLNKWITTSQNTRKFGRSPGTRMAWVERPILLQGQNTLNR